MIEKLNQIIEGKSIAEQIEALARKFPAKIAFSSSFGQEDQALTDIIFGNHLPVRVFTLDTGRFFPETYEVWQKTSEKYPEAKIEAFFPNAEQVEKLLSKKGPYSFYESVENRKECCNIRKVYPLARALEGVKIWITGLRAEQSQARADLQSFEYDEAFELIKFNPLKDWTLEDTVQYLTEQDVPYNKLHDKGFLSIGCRPCTRAVKKGEDIRAGRWWWEDKSKKECGLHDTKEAEIKFKVSKIS